MEYKDYYKTLGVQRDAGVTDIKKQYRKLARKYHPDVSKEPNAEEKFKEVQEAYEVLKDPEKRQAYDQLGSQWRAGQGFTPPPGWEYQQRNTQQGEPEVRFASGDFSDFFEAIFGGRARRASGFERRSFQQRGQDQATKINLTLAEAFHGCVRTLQLQDQEIDPQTGQIQLKTRQLKVKIPTGVIQDQHIRLANQGGRGIGGAANGDLYLEINILPHPIYSVQGRDITLHLPVTPWEAALGTKVPVPTLGGTVELKIPPGSQTGNKLRLKGRGLPGTLPGDQYVLLKIIIPLPQTEKQRQLYQQMAQEMPFNPREELIGVNT